MPSCPIVFQLISALEVTLIRAINAISRTAIAPTALHISPVSILLRAQITAARIAIAPDIIRSIIPALVACSPARYDTNTIAPNNPSKSITTDIALSIPSGLSNDNAAITAARTAIAPAIASNITPAFLA